MKSKQRHFARVAPSIVACILSAGEARAQTWTNLVSNSGFLGGSVAPWVAKSNSPSASFVSVRVSTDGFTTLELALSDPGTEVTNLEVGQTGIGITSGRTYRVTFWGMADPSFGYASARVKLGAVAPPYASYFERDVVIPHIGPADYGQTFQYSFTAPASDSNAWFGVFVGGNGGTIKLDSLYLEEYGTVSAGTGGAPGTGGAGQGGNGGTPGGGTASAIRVNQVGYLTSWPKRATAVTNDAGPITWRLLDGARSEVSSGSARAFGNDAVSGDTVQVIDFSSFRGAGDDFRLVVGGTESLPFRIAADVFAPIRRSALRFFYHQRASTAIVAPFAEGSQWERAAGHPDDNVSCSSGCTYSLDVSKGWYDAGDHGKYVVNGGIALFTLLDLYERTVTLGTTASELGDGTLGIPEGGNGAPDLLDEARWELEFMLGMQVPDGQPLAGMAHHKIHDDDWTPLPTAPASDATPRHLHAPSTAATLNLAAVAAQCARAFAGVDDAFAARCLAASKRAYDAAVANPGRFAPASDSIGGGAYEDDEVSDEFFWAAAELYVATGSKTYEDAVKSSTHFAQIPAGRAPFSWPSVAGLGTVSLAVSSKTIATDVLSTARRSVVAAADRYVEALDASGYASPLDTHAWGSNSEALNVGIVLALAFDITGDARYSAGALATLDGVLGRNALGQSFVSGFGQPAFQNPHHRFFARGIDPTWPPPPSGFIAGGPNADLNGLAPTDPLQGCRGPKCWKDDAAAFSLTEVAVNWNAPLAWVAAWAHEIGTKPSATHPGIDNQGTGVVPPDPDGGPGVGGGGTGSGGRSGIGGRPGGGTSNEGGTAGVELDAGAPDGSPVAARGAASDSGCGCRSATAPLEPEWSLALATLLAFGARRRRSLR
jgi:endoglucanase